MKFFDDKSKNLKWWNKNYFYIGTIAIVLLNILLYAFGGYDWEERIYPVDGGHHWGDVFYFRPTIRTFLNAFSHSTWQHVLLNMLCFAVVGLYLERKKGTLGIFLYVLIGAYFSGIAVVANDMAINFHGSSGVNYFLYAILIVDYFFSLRKETKNKTNIILGAVILAFTYLAMCFDDRTSSFSFRWYPYKLMTNLGHYSSFVVGLVLGLIIQTTRALAAKGKIK